MAKRIRKTVGGGSVHVRIPKQHRKQFQDYAAKENRSLSGAILHLATRMLAVVSARV